MDKNSNNNPDETTKMLKALSNNEESCKLWLERAYIDEKGYKRNWKNEKLIHRDIAYKEIYLKNKDRYPEPFSEYVVHHIDGNKKNNSASNLKLIKQNKHMLIHSIEYRKEKIKDIQNTIKLMKEKLNE